MSAEAKSSITDGYYPDKILIRGYRIDEMIKRLTFSDATFLAIFGRLPTKEESTLMNAMLVACIDHGFAPAQPYRILEKGGVPVFYNPQPCLKVIKHLIDYTKFREKHVNLNAGVS